MKKFFGKVCYLVPVSALMLMFGMTVMAKDEATVKPGIYAGDIDLSGMTAAMAENTVESYIEDLRGVEITLLMAEETEVVVTAGDLGLAWANPELVTEALEIGTHGNVIERYKAMKDLEHENKVYPIQLCLDLQTVSDFLTLECAKYDKKPVDFDLERVNGEFHVIEGQVGYTLDVEKSIDLVNDRLVKDWDGQPCTIALDVKTDEPRGSEEELLQVKDILGSFTTSYKTSTSDRCANVENGCRLINGQLLYPGEEFSMYETVSPITTANGYYLAGAYQNGRVVDSVGGGICQVSTTLYNAVLRSEIDVTERHNHSMVVSYVEPAADAAIAESAGKDFRFINNLKSPIYIEGYTNDRKITFNIYGVETRSPGHSVRYESEVLEVIQPTTEAIYEDASKPIGYIVTQGAHIGYKSRLWKIVTEDGEEVSRTVVNNSSYRMSPRSATVGTATSDPNAYAQLKAAISSNSIANVKSTVAALTAPPPAPQ